MDSGEKRGTKKKDCATGELVPLSSGLLSAESKEPAKGKKQRVRPDVVEGGKKKRGLKVLAGAGALHSTKYRLKRTHCDARKWQEKVRRKKKKWRRKNGEKKKKKEREVHNMKFKYASRSSNGDVPRGKSGKFTKKQPALTQKGGAVTLEQLSETQEELNPLLLAGKRACPLSLKRER